MFYIACCMLCLFDRTTNLPNWHGLNKSLGIAYNAVYKPLPRIQRLQINNLHIPKKQISKTIAQLRNKIRELCKKK